MGRRPGILGTTTWPIRRHHPEAERAPVDLQLAGCPVSKDELEKAVQHLVWGLPLPEYADPVCVQCKQRTKG